nr:hypothetical protein [Clostridium septicum]
MFILTIGIINIIKFIISRKINVESKAITFILLVNPLNIKIGVDSIIATKESIKSSPDIIFIMSMVLAPVK